MLMHELLRDLDDSEAPGDPADDALADQLQRRETGHHFGPVEEERAREERAHDGAEDAADHREKELVERPAASPHLPVENRTSSQPPEDEEKRVGLDDPATDPKER